MSALIPATLAAALAEATHSVRAGDLAAASARLSHAYRTDRGTPLNLTLGTAERAAYMVARMPATYAVCASVLDRLASNCPAFAPRSMLDVGAGPGTAGWAATQTFDTLVDLSCFEKDPQWVTMGRRLAQAGNATLQGATWQRYDALSGGLLPKVDVVMASYALNEVPAAQLPAVLTRLWGAATGALVLIEPGSRQGFNVIRAAREVLTAQGGHIVAPCPHAGACPLAADNWCHFPQHVQRSAAHRQAKDGTLGSEVEKYSYLIVTREAFGAVAAPDEARIIAAPMRRSGHTALDVCTSQGQQVRVTVSRRDPAAYRAVRDTEWGDLWTVSAAAEAGVTEEAP